MKVQVINRKFQIGAQEASMFRYRTVLFFKILDSKMVIKNKV